MTAAFLAISAWRPSGLSRRPSSVVRSTSLVMLACMASSLRSAFSLRLRCLSTPAASSISARLASGPACSTWSSWPWPTMTCISRPSPESDNSSWMSSSRQWSPLSEYSLWPDRNSRRLIVTSAYSIASAPSLLSIVSVTSARPSGGRDEVPANTTSSILPPRSDLTPCSPITQDSASTMLDFPEPFGPTTHVIPGSKRSVLSEAKDLNPRRASVFRCTRGISSFVALSRGRAVARVALGACAACPHPTSRRRQFPGLLHTGPSRGAMSGLCPGGRGTQRRTTEQGQDRRIGTPKGASLIRDFPRRRDRSGEDRLAGSNEQVVVDLQGERVLLLLKPVELSLKIQNALLEATHLVDHAEIWSADVA